MTRKDIESIYPLSPMQQGMLFHSLYDPDSKDYMEQTTCRLMGEMDQHAFEQAWQSVVKRHSILRTAFVWRKVEQPVQVVQAEVKLPFVYEDWSCYSDTEQEVRLANYLKADLQRAFDLTKAPLLRLAVFRISPGEHILVWSHHHLILDGWSVPLLVGDVMAYYESYCSGQNIHLPSTRPYRDYIAWLKKQDLAQAESFWRNYLKDFSVPTPLGFERFSPPLSSTVDYEEIELALPEKTGLTLKDFALRNGLTLSTLMEAAWAILLNRYTREDDVVFGRTVSGRPMELSGAESMVGLMINTLPVRVQFTGESILMWLKTLQAMAANLSQFDYSPLVKIHEWSQVPSGMPLFDSLVIFENYPSRFDPERSARLKFSDIRNLSHTNYPVVFIAAARRDIVLKLSYDTRRLETSQAHLALGHLSVILQEMVSHPDLLPTEIQILTPYEKQQVLVEWNRATMDIPVGVCAHTLFEQQVDRTPDATALIFDDQQLSFAELDCRANQLTNYLAKFGSPSNSVTAILLDRSFEMIIAMLAIQKARMAFLPIDTNYPADRIKYMLEDSGAVLLITNHQFIGLFSDLKTPMINLESTQHEIELESSERLASQAEPGDLAYVIYTSGSTGLPKGTLLEHRGLVNLILNQVRDFEIAPGKRVLQFASIGFDAATAEIYHTLCGGASLVLAPKENLTSLPHLVRLLRDQGITTVTLPPTLLAILPPDEFPNITTVISAGEACPVDIATRWSCGRSFINAYGPTETTVAAAWYKVDPCATCLTRVPIGRPLPNTVLYVVDSQGFPVPIGVPGELLVGGVNLARGYLNRPELTKEKFISDPFSTEKGARLYKTGDLVRRLPNGNLEFLGRIDQQVKIRGFRIELGEIEAALCRYPSIRQAAVVAREDGPGDLRLVAFIIPAQPLDPPGSTELRSFLKNSLPEFMLPAAFVCLDHFPLTVSGKINRNALQTRDLPQAFAQTSDIVGPHTPTEEILCGIWSRVLHVENVGINNNFSDLGGHSLLATQVMARIRDVFQIDLPLRVLFETSSLAEMAARIDQSTEAENRNSEPLLVPVEREDEIPLSFSQQRLWFLNQLEPDNPFYNLTTAIRLKGYLDREALQAGLQDLVQRHESLRTFFKSDDGKPYQIIVPSMELKMKFVDIRHLSPEKRDEAAQKLAEEEARLPFNLSVGPLIRCLLIRLSDTQHLVILTLHHIIADGWSMGILANELAVMYRMHSDSCIFPLPELTIQYADYAVWQRLKLQGESLDRQLDYWKQRLAGLNPLLDLPIDRPRPSIQTYHGSQEAFRWNAKITRDLNAFCRHEGITLYMLLLAVYQTLLYRYSGQEDIPVGTAIANRTRPALEGLVGIFVNTLVMRTDFSGEPTFRDLLKRVREVCLGAYVHQDVPFEMLVEVLQPERNLSHSPLFQAAFDMQTPPALQSIMPGVEMEPVVIDTGSTPYDLLLSIAVLGDELAGSLEYNTDLFNATTIRRFIHHFEILLNSALNAPDQPVSHLAYLSDEELHKILIDWNQTKLEFPNNCTIQQLFEQWAEQTPDAIALAFNDQTLTYRELNQRANRLAHYLRRNGLVPGSLVGICLERSFDMITSILGSLKAGCAYLPLDPFYPKERLSFMLVDSQAPFLLTSSNLIDHFNTFPSQTIFLDACWPKILAEAQPEDLMVCTTSAQDLAYVIYTSGSTGRPKGAALRHQGLCNLANYQKQVFTIQPGCRVLQFSSFSFDASVWEIFMALANGATLVLASQEIISSAPDLVELLKRQRVTHLTLSPSVLLVLPETNLPDLEVLVSAGESCPIELVTRWASGRRFFNAYGPTEATVCASMTLCSVQDLQPPSIGTPIANTRLYILDQHREPLPDGVPGELYISGVCVSSGYLNRPELTAEKFISDPFYPDSKEKMYRTGDIVRFRADGQVEFLGRADDQVKIRGFRIELGEIETALLEQPGIDQAVVLARQDRPGDKRLVAYLCSKTEDQAGLRLALRGALRRRLPEYMVPTAFVFLADLPISPNGKVDRKRLPAPDSSHISMSNQTKMLPRTTTEVRLIEICKSLLAVDEMGINDNFFELGGHSLLAAQFISRIRDAFQVDLPLRTLFEMPTISDLAAHLDGNNSSNRDQQEKINQALKAVQDLSTEDLEKLFAEPDDGSMKEMP